MSPILKTGGGPGGMYGRGGSNEGGWLDGRPGGEDGRTDGGIDGGTADAGRTGTGGGGVTDLEGRATTSGADGSGGGGGGIGRALAVDPAPLAERLGAGAAFAAPFPVARVAGARLPVARLEVEAAEAEERLAVGEAGRLTVEGIFSFGCGARPHRVRRSLENPELDSGAPGTTWGQARQSGRRGIGGRLFRS